MAIPIPEIYEITFNNQSLAYRKAAIKAKLEELNKPKNAVEYRLEMRFLTGRQDYYSSADDNLLKVAKSVKIVVLWKDSFLRYGYWTYRYYNQPTEEATPQEFEDWIVSLEEPMKSDFREEGLEACRGVLNFMRFVNELRDMGMDEFLQKHMSKEDWEEYSARQNIDES